MLWSLNELHHVTLDVLMAPYRENDIFGFLGFGMQIDGEQNTVSTVGITVFAATLGSSGIYVVKRMNMQNDQRLHQEVI